MPLPRFPCPVCERSTAVTLSGGVPHRYYRHDPAAGRTQDLKSCPGSLKPVEAAGVGQPGLFPVRPLLEGVRPDGEAPTVQRLF